MKATETVKSTVRIPASLWKAARHRALDEDCDFQTLVTKALQQYLKTPERAR
jgi:hypothetical protein